MLPDPETFPSGTERVFSMQRQPFFYPALCLAVSGIPLTFAFFQCLALEAPPLRIRESKPITVNGATFVTVAQTEWNTVNAGAGPATVDLQLRVTNVTKKDLIFFVRDRGCLGLTLKKDDGTEVKAHDGGAKSSVIPRFILLSPGASYTLPSISVLTWDRDIKATALDFRDDSGFFERYGPVSMGKYKLSLWFSTKDVDVSPSDQKALAGIAPLWLGYARTAEVSIEVTAPRAQKKQ